jgi:hypothetical protein
MLIIATSTQQYDSMKQEYLHIRTDAELKEAIARAAEDSDRKPAQWVRHELTKVLRKGGYLKRV